jgi:hypothetical protein
MSANGEIRERRCSNAAPSTIFHNRSAGDETCPIGKREPAERFGAKAMIKVTHGRGSRGNLSIDDGIDRDFVPVGGVAQRGLEAERNKGKATFSGRQVVGETAGLTLPPPWAPSFPLNCSAAP